MRQLRALLARFIVAVREWRGGTADAELREELEAHLEMETAENVRRGMDPGEARRQALLAAGGLTVASELVRERRGLPWAEEIGNDLRYAVRTLRAEPAFSAAALGTLALGIGSVVAMFTILNAVILRRLPYPDSDRILSISLSEKGTDRRIADDHSYEEWVRSARSVAVIAAYGASGGVMRTKSGPRQLRGTAATAQYFAVLGAKPMLGRAFTDQEARPGEPSLVLLAEPLWRTSFAADPEIVGQTVIIDGDPAVVTGIMPAWFAEADRAQFWVPLRVQPRENGATYYHVLARTRRGVSIKSVQSELAAIQQRLDPRLPRLARGFEPAVMTLHERLYGRARRPLMLLFAAVGVLLLITCANLANLSLARSTKRQREFALRLTLGAGGWRLVRYVLLESLVLSVGGAVLGLLLAGWSIGYFVRISPESVANVDQIGIDETVLLFTLGIAAATSVLFGLVPALVAVHGGRTTLIPSSNRMTASRWQRLVQRSMVVVELATALVLIIGAGLVTRTFQVVASIPVGFDPEHVLTVDVQLPWDRYTDTTARPVMEKLLERVRHQPGVQSAALVDALPLTGTHRSMSVTSEGKPALAYGLVAVTPGYFTTLGTRIAEGRPIEGEDLAGGAATAVVSVSLARLVSPKQSAVGQRLGGGTQAPMIVGVAEDVRQWELEGVPPPVAFVPLSA